MKYIALIICVLMVGCAGQDINFTTPELPPDLCGDYDIETSFLMKTVVDKGLSLNDIYYGLLDAATIAMIVEVTDKNQLRDAMMDLSEWYNDNYPITYLTLIDYMSDSQKASLIASIISRRIGMFASPLLISEYDNCLLRAGWNGAMRDLYLK